MNYPSQPCSFALKVFLSLGSNLLFQQNLTNHCLFSHPWFSASCTSVGKTDRSLIQFSNSENIADVLADRCMRNFKKILHLLLAEPNRFPIGRYLNFEAQSIITEYYNFVFHDSLFSNTIILYQYEMVAVFLIGKK